MRNRSRGSFSENSVSSPRSPRRSPKRVQSPKRIAPVYSGAAYQQPVEYVPRLNPAAVPVMKQQVKPRRSDSKIRARDIHQMQDAINRDYEEKVEAVNREAQ